MQQQLCNTNQPSFDIIHQGSADTSQQSSVQQPSNTSMQNTLNLSQTQQLSEVVSPLVSPQIPSPQVLTLTPNTKQQQQNNPAGGHVLQQIAQQPLFQQQQNGGHQHQQQQNAVINSTGQQSAQHNQMIQQSQQQQLKQEYNTNTNNTNAATSTNNSHSPQKAAVKKGRFWVVKGASEDNQSQSIAAAAAAASSVKKGRFVVKKQTGVTPPVATEPLKDGSNLSPRDIAAAKENDFIVDDGKSNITDEQAKQQANRNNSPTPQRPAIAKGNNRNNSPLPQKKGRFLVKTGASAANLQPVEKDATSSALEGGQEKTEVEIDQEVAMKKKGRFVVKTGGGGNLTNSPGGTNNATTLAASLPDGAQNVGLSLPSNIQQPIIQQPNIQQPNYYAGNVNIPLAAIPAANSLVDVNGQLMVVPNLSTFPLVQQTAHHLQQQQQIPAGQQPQFVNISAHISRAQRALSSIGSQVPPQQLQPLPNFSDALVQPPPRASMADERSFESNLTPKAHTSRSNRPAGNSGSNWSSLKGKNGRMIGGGGVGKMLHHLDNMRTEIVEADRSILSLQSDNRIFKDKNKELEAKNRELLRTLADEKKRRQAAEDKYQCLCQQISRQTELDRENRIHAGSVTKSDCKSDLIQNKSSSEQNMELGTSSFEEDMQQKTATTSIDKVKPAPTQKAGISSAQNSPLPKRLTVSRNNSFDVLPDASRLQTPPGGTSSQSTSCLNSMANQFDPLRAPPPPFEDSNIEYIDEKTNAQNNECTTHVKSKQHFDPLGTPKRQDSPAVKDIKPTPAVTLDALPQIPISATHNGDNVSIPIIAPKAQHQPQQKSREEDPFDEIVRSRRHK